ncbi:hypothetical protein [Acinetobacter sp. GSS19]|uniref:hypothetical protein n=1 Tax=Acinetobacter sp. GSS19 TaxID=3020716 RepID=UPI00236155B4|nr:hypothetical protein [Acinetobacter sp. GSS19]
MLHFWYSERCTRPIKLLICIVTVAVTLYFSEMTKLSTSLTLLSLLLGMVIHGLYSLLLKLPQPNSAWSQSFKILLDLTFLMGWAVLLLQLPTEQQLAQAVQLFGFSLTGFYIVSIYANRTPRY